MERPEKLASGPNECEVNMNRLVILLVASVMAEVPEVDLR